jgi:non-haem Fe2+, alpha-ketoglutarate-dependent halogenase
MIPATTNESSALRDTFFRDGFVGPIPIDLPRRIFDGAAARLDKMLDESAPHPLYGRFSVRDWHLLDDDLLAILSHPQIVEAVASILGPDLLLWRSKVFAKKPGEGELGWHQEWGAFNGEEIGNDRPSLEPSAAARLSDDPWNITVWVALDDVADDMGPIRFARGTHRRRFPIAMKPLLQSEFWHDPFLGIGSVGEIVTLAAENSLVLDIDTSQIFAGVDTTRLTLDQAKKTVLDTLGTQVGAVTLDFDPDEHEVIDMPMSCGSFVVFSERVMHGSSANHSSGRRLAVNGRYTRADTVVYPFRARKERIDGSNLDITNHSCVLVSGRSLSESNIVLPSPSAKPDLDKGRAVV